MGSVIVSLLPLIIGSAVVPVQIIITILLLKNPSQGLLKAWAYVGGTFRVFTLGVIGMIGEAQLGQPSSTVAFLLFVLLAESLLLLPILVRMIIPEQSKSLLESTSAWLTRYNRPIVIVVSLIFGLLFLYQVPSGFLYI